MSKASQEIIVKLKELATTALASGEAGAVETFIDQTAEYLTVFEQWQKDLAGSNPLSEQSDLSSPDKENLRGKVSELNELHQQLMKHAVIEKDQISSAMGDMHRRAAGLKKYIDTWPSRITIAGKRKG